MHCRVLHCKNITGGQSHVQDIEKYVANKIIEKLIPPLPKGASEQKIEEYEKSLENEKTDVEDTSAKTNIINN